MDNTSLIAVYGTLRRGQSNYFRLLDNPAAKFVGFGWVHGYKLLDLGSFPGAVPAKDKKVAIEVFEVTPKVLADLDRLEGHPHFYRRTKVTAKLEDKRKAVEMYVYCLDVSERCPEVEGGNWVTWKIERSLRAS